MMLIITSQEMMLFFADMQHVHLHQINMHIMSTKEYKTDQSTLGEGCQDIPLWMDDDRIYYDCYKQEKIQSTH